MTITGTYIKHVCTTKFPLKLNVKDISVQTKKYTVVIYIYVQKCFRNYFDDYYLLKLLTTKKKIVYTILFHCNNRTISKFPICREYLSHCQYKQSS